MTTEAPPGLNDLRDAAVAAITAATTLDELDAARNRWWGKKGELGQVQRALGGLDADARRAVGAQVNALRETLVAADAERRAALEAERDRVALAAEAIDVTLPPRVPPRGRLHPVVETMDAMVDAFTRLGYTVATGPEVESDWFNFEALNMPADHPARSLWDTLYVEDLPGSPPGSTVLRTHTSPVQARTMLAQPPPVYVVAPGRVYRQDTPDATHLPVFHQIEGLAVDEGLSFGDLRGTLAEFCRQVLGSEAKVRLRPDYFPFTEPSCEVDVYVPWTGRWMELLGAGMVNPNVYRAVTSAGAVGYDPELVSGFAFGMGVERFAMLRHGVDDLRLFIENDLRFLRSF